MKHYCILLLLLSVSFTVISQQIGDCNIPTAYAELDINNVNAGVMNGGDMWWDTNSRSYTVPINSGINSIFSGSIWMGGIDDDGALKVSQQTYRQNGNTFWPGPIDNNSFTTENATCNNYDKIWKVNKSSIDNFQLGITLSEEEYDEIYSWPGFGNPHLSFTINQDMAPFTDVNADGIYNPDDGDYPLIKGDQACWWLINDIGNQRNESLNGAPLSFEIKVMAFAYNSVVTFDNSTFYEYKVTNKSSKNYSDFLFAQFTDFDLGYNGDDFVGCDSVAAITYAYNSDVFDEGVNGYGDNIPVQAIQFVEVPDNNYGTNNRIYAAVNYDNDFSNSGNPENSEDYYNYLIGNWKQGIPITKGYEGTVVTNVPMRYMFPSNPSDCTPEAWSECNYDGNCTSLLPEDARMVMSSGKYDFAEGETKTFLIAAHTIFGVELPCPDIQPVIDLANETTAFFDEIVSLNEYNLIEENAVTAYPNPSNDIIIIETDLKIKSLQIINIAGQVVKQQNNIETIIDVSDLSTGNYLLKLSFENGAFGREKISIIK